MYKKFFLENEIISDSYLVNGQKIIITKLNWNYESALAFQEKANLFIYQNPSYSIYIITSHPAVLTMGRGLQKRLLEQHSLTEFNLSQIDELPIKVLQIKRGGGITFHHPGQIVIYPIVHITSQRVKTIELMNYLFEVTKKAIESVSAVKDLDYKRDLLGLWIGKNKVASMGIQLTRFVSMHGLALNVLENAEINRVLPLIFPCGLSGTTYKSLNQVDNVSYDSLVEKLKENLLQLPLSEKSLTF